jgi:hypothetical protein
MCQPLRDWHAAVIWLRFRHSAPLRLAVEVINVFRINSAALPFPLLVMAMLNVA